MLVIEFRYYFGGESSSRWDALPGRQSSQGTNRERLAARYGQSKGSFWAETEPRVTSLVAATEASQFFEVVVSLVSPKMPPGFPFRMSVTQSSRIPYIVGGSQGSCPDVPSGNMAEAVAAANLETEAAGPSFAIVQFHAYAYRPIYA